MQQQGVLGHNSATLLLHLLLCQRLSVLFWLIIKVKGYTYEFCDQQSLHPDCLTW